MGSGGRLESIVFSGHALRQMFARSIAVDDVRSVIDEGEAIAPYPDDRPHPSELRLGFPGGRALHVVFAYDEASSIGYVVTTYVPDSKLWSKDFKTRK